MQTFAVSQPFSAWVPDLPIFCPNHLDLAHIMLVSAALYAVWSQPSHCMGYMQLSRMKHLESIVWHGG